MGLIPGEAFKQKAGRSACPSMEPLKEEAEPLQPGF
jgi:hypothetical protein